MRSDTASKGRTITTFKDPEIAKVYDAYRWTEFIPRYHHEWRLAYMRGLAGKTRATSSLIPPRDSKAYGAYAAGRDARQAMIQAGWWKPRSHRKVEEE